MSINKAIINFLMVEDYPALNVPWLQLWTRSWLLVLHTAVVAKSLRLSSVVSIPPPRARREAIQPISPQRVMSVELPST